MSDTYQAIYDAVRSKISNGDIGTAIENVARQSFDIYHQVDIVKNEFLSVAYEMQRPFYLLKPKLYPDGNMWCCLYGDDLQNGVCGFGDTPEKAAIDFDINWKNQKLRMMCDESV